MLNHVFGVTPDGHGDGAVGVSGLSSSSDRMTAYDAQYFQSLSVEDLAALSAQVEADIACTSPAVLAVASQQAEAHANNMNIEFLPYTTDDNIYEVQSFGQIVTSDPNHIYHNTHYIYPREYTSKISLKIYIIPTTTTATDNNTTSSNTNYAYKTVDIINTIIIPPAPKFRPPSTPPTFQLSIENVGILCESNTPYNVYNTLLSQAALLLPMLGSKLRRCRAVFNQLCCHPEITPFLEQISGSGHAGIAYYKMVTAPMWLREVSIYVYSMCIACLCFVRLICDIYYYVIGLCIPYIYGIAHAVYISVNVQIILSIYKY